MGLSRNAFLLLATLFVQACGPGFLPDYNKLNSLAVTYADREPIDNPAVRCFSGNKRVDRVVDRIALASKTRNWCIKVEENPQRNAYVTQDKNVVVFTGLIQFTKSDDELAAIIGHEMAHVVLGHGMQQVRDLQTLESLKHSMASQNQGTSDLVLQKQLAVLAYTLLIAKPYSRERELEADSLGLMYLHRGDYDPSAGVRVWIRMQKENKVENLVSEFFATHPISETRIVNLMRMLAGVYLNE